MTVLWSSDPGAAERLQLALDGDVVQLSDASRVTRALEENRAHTLVVIGADVALADACQLAEQQRVGHPELGVLLLRNRVDVTALSQALRSGVREVVDVGDTRALSTAVQRSRELTERMRAGAHQSGPGGKVVLVFSAKGGVGKTTVATNLAAYLASTGARTLLVDLDLMFGDCAITLQLEAGRSLASAVTMAGDLDAEAIGSLTVSHPGSGLQVIPAPPDPADAETVSAALVTELLRAARSTHQYVVVDTPPSITEHVLAAFDVADATLLLATLDIPALKNLRIAINTLDTLGADPGSRVVLLNRASDKAGLSTDEVTAALKAEVAAELPTSIDVQVATNRGEALAVTSPKHPWAAALRAAADTQVRERFGETLPAPSGRRRGRRLGRR